MPSRWVSWKVSLPSRSKPATCRRNTGSRCAWSLTMKPRMVSFLPTMKVRLSGPGHRLVVRRDHPAGGDPPERVHHRQRGAQVVAADVLEVAVDAFGCRLLQQLASRRRRGSRRRRRSPARRAHFTFSGVPADPTTRSPACLASWPAMLPTAPDAAETNIVSPGRTSAMSKVPTHAVSPGMPSTPRYADTGTPSASGSSARPAARDDRPLPPAETVPHDRAPARCPAPWTTSTRPPRRRTSAGRSGTARRRTARRSSARACRGPPT